MLELAVLGLLKEQPLHGYELKKRLSETLGFLWGVSYGSLYPALRRLERESSIEVIANGPAAPEPFRATGSLTGDLAAARRAGGDRPRANRRVRKAYRITDAGEAAFERLLLVDDPHTDDEKAFALKLAFCSHLAPADRLALLEHRRTALDARLSRARHAGPARADRYSIALLEHRARATQRDLEWIDELIALEHYEPKSEAADEAGHPAPSEVPTP